MIDQLETIRQEIATCGAGEGCHFWGCSDMRALFARVTELEAGLQTIENLVNAPQWDTARRYRVGEIASAAIAGKHEQIGMEPTNGSATPGYKRTGPTLDDMIHAPRPPWFLECGFDGQTWPCNAARADRAKQDLA